MTDDHKRRIWEIENSCEGRTELAERIVGLEDRLAMYENDHQIVTHVHGSWKRLKAEVPKLREENAKLRELVRAAWLCIHTGASCSDCRLIAGGCTLQSAMRELGIEVDK